MPLSWNEIKSHAVVFTNEWKNEAQEHAEAKSFWDAFFNVFGISRRRIATFEQSVKKLNDKQGFIDLFWSGTLLVEHKSKGKDLDKAYEQALGYFHGLKEHELPRYVLVSDFENFRLFDLDKNTQHEFTIREFVQNIHLFGFIAGYEQRIYQDEDPVNIKAAELMGKLHDKLKAVGYVGHDLEVYLVRLLFCLFAEDTGIFEKSTFQEYIELHTKEDGSDLAMHLAQLFQILDTPKDERLGNIDENQNQFPYVNGALFHENIRFAAFDSSMRTILLKACRLDWGGISPAIFGSMFQAAMDTNERRNLGAHYTSEKNIQKLIRPLFLDELYAEFEKIDSQPKLLEFQQKLANLKFFDPACGSGNFLIITYRELRALEIKVLEKLLFEKQGIRREVMADSGVKIDLLIKVNIDQFYGIEIDEFAAQIAQVGMWLLDHQMNLKVSEIFGQYFVRLPLNASATIVHGNSLHLDWGSLMNVTKDKTIESQKVNIIKVDKLPENRYTENVNSPKELQEAIERYGTVNIITTEVNYIQPVVEKGFVAYDYIMGNPPFIGKQLRNEGQNQDMDLVFHGVKGYKNLDYVAAWYYKAAKFIQNTKTEVAFVSTNSVTQGEQVGILWNELLTKYNVNIHFAHRTFKWNNEAKGNANVFVVIVGFRNFNKNGKRLFDYESSNSEPKEIKVKNINPYLIEANNLLILKRSKPLINVPKVMYGNKLVDDGNYLFTDLEKEKFIKQEPNSESYFRPILSGKEFLNGNNRWCLYLANISPTDLKKMPLVLERVLNVKNYRASSKKGATVKASETPTLFAEARQPKNDFILIPRTTSEHRTYIPFAFFNAKYIVNDSCIAIPNADFYLFGMITSKMHMAWVKYTCGRLKSDFRYSNTLVYNNYPFPKNVNEKSRAKVEQAAQKVLDTRAEFPKSSLADLYDPLAMPPNLVKAHQALDKAVDLCYRSQAFTNERSRIEFLFDLYEQYTAPLMVVDKKKGKKLK